MRNGDLLVERERSMKAMEDLKKKYDQESNNRSNQAVREDETAQQSLML